ncbi:MAG: methylmalonyl-CoA mutase family protein [Nannocystaceae bacterium]
MPSDDAQPLLSEFPAVDLARWQAKLDSSLDAATIEGPTIHALYTADEPAAGPRPPGRAPGWRVAQEYALGDLESLRTALSEDAARGLEAAWVGLHGDLRAGARAPATLPGAVGSAADLASLVAAVGPEVALVLDAGLAAPDLLSALLSARQSAQLPGGREATPADAVLLDPLATLASTGALGTTLDDAYAALAQSTRLVAARRPSARTVLVDVVPAHDAGASAQQEVAVAIAAGIEHLRRLEAQGLAPAEVVPHLVLRMAVGGDLLVEIAKLRATRRLWSRVRAHAGAGSGAPTELWVRSSWRHTTVRDPWVNLLRGTVAAFAATVGGASAVAVQPFTETLGVPGASARRWALNTQHILRGESHLGRVDDPAAGSWAFEALTDDLSRGAWEQVRQWLGRGGLGTLIADGQLQSELAERGAARSTALATGTLVSTGTTAYPLLDERRVEVGPVAVSDPGVDAKPQVTAPPLSRRRPTEPFELLRDRSDALLRSGGKRPRAMLVPVGDLRRARPQLDFARNLAEVGGFETTVLDPDSTLSERARVAIVCGPPEALAEEGPAGIGRLLAAGVSRVLVAGRPTEALREAGVHDFVHRGRDVVAVLRALHDEILPASPGQEVSR